MKPVLVAVLLVLASGAFAGCVTDSEPAPASGGAGDAPATDGPASGSPDDAGEPGGEPAQSEPDEPGAAGDEPPTSEEPAQNEEPAPTGPTATGPQWSFTDTDGVTHSRDSAAGDPTLLFFMASWCSTCAKKTQTLRGVQADYAGAGVDFYSLSFDSSDSDGSLDQWKDRYNQQWPHAVDPNLATGRTFNIRSQSSVVVLDAEGEVVRQWGYPGPSENDLRGALDQALSA